jgi:hypothetical protein
MKERREELLLKYFALQTALDTGNGNRSLKGGFASL